MMRVAFLAKEASLRIRFKRPRQAAWYWLSLLQLNAPSPMTTKGAHCSGVVRLSLLRSRIEAASAVDSVRFWSPPTSLSARCSALFVALRSASQ